MFKQYLKGKATLNLCSHILFIVISMLHTNENKVQIKRDIGENIENMPVMGAAILTIRQLSAPDWAVTTSHFYVTGLIHIRVLATLGGGGWGHPALIITTQHSSSF